MTESRGAGTAGGLLFTLVVLFLGYLAIRAVAGVVQWLIGVAIIVVLVMLVVRVFSRR